MIVPLPWRWPLLVELPVEQAASRLRASQSHNLSIGELVHVLLDGEGMRLVTLKAVSGPGDDGEPVMTFMLPEED